MVQKLKMESGVWQLEDGSACGAISTVCKEVVLCGAEAMAFGEFEKPTGYCSGALCTDLQPARETDSNVEVNKYVGDGSDVSKCRRWVAGWREGKIGQKTQAR